MFWMQLIAIIAEIILALLKRRNSDAPAQVVSNERHFSELRSQAVKTRDLTELRAFRDSLKRG